VAGEQQHLLDVLAEVVALVVFQPHQMVLAVLVVVAHTVSQEQMELLILALVVEVGLHLLEQVLLVVQVS
jgi:hypothetical protein